MAGLVLTVMPNPVNPDVVHFGIITQEEAEAEAAAFKARVDEALKNTILAGAKKDSDVKSE
jgi:hypothetical protein